MQLQQQSPSLRNQTIENYIQRVTELSQLGQKIPSNEELSHIASELGITEEEIISAKKQSEAHYIRAQGYSNLRHWDDAIDELQEAVAFNPINLKILNLLALCHFGRWQEHHKREDMIQIKMRVKQCLEIQPDHEESLQLLSTLDKAQSQRQHQKVAIASALSIIIGSAIGYSWLNNINFNLLTKTDIELENLRTGFNEEILELKQEQQILINQLTEKNRQNQQENLGEINRLNNQVKSLQNQVQNLSRQNQILIDKLTKIERERNYIILPENPRMR